MQYYTRLYTSQSMCDQYTSWYTSQYTRGILEIAGILVRIPEVYQSGY